MHRLTIAAIVLVVIIGTGCDSTPTSPSIANVAGNWGGTTCAPSLIVSCVIQMTISQEGSALAGTWGTATSRRGTLTGTISGSTVSLLLTGEFQPVTLTLTFDKNRDQMSGPYTAQSTISVTRQAS